MIYYFAYGSNLSFSQMKRRCPDSKFYNKGILKDHCLKFNGYSNTWKGAVANVVKMKKEKVYGIIYTMTIADLKLLDKFEGYPHSYRRKMISITLFNGFKLKNVWVYYKVDVEDFAPSSKYLNIIKSASYSFGFPKDYQSMLKSIKTVTVKVDKISYQQFLLPASKLTKSHDYLKPIRRIEFEIDYYDKDIDEDS